VLAERLGVSTGALRSYAAARTMPRPATMRALAELAGTRVTRVYAELGWLPEHEVPHTQQPDLLTQLESTREAVARLTETLDGIPSESTGRAAVLASAALLDDPQAGPRFQVRLRALEAGGRCPVVTTLVAEFSPQDTARPHDPTELQARALAAGLRPARSAWLRAGTDDPAAVRHHLFQTELEVVTAEALERAGDFSWQGQPGTILWRPVSRRWPTHLLVQHVLTGQPFSPRRPWASTDGLPVVVIGADYSIGATAALLAGALGWRYAPVTSATAFDSGRLVRFRPLAPAAGRRQGWIAAARRAGTLADPAEPWPAVLLVRPYVFGEQDSHDEATCRLLRDVRAHVVYARPSAAHLDWWAARRQLTARAARPSDEWRAETYRALARVEEVLEERRAALGPDHDLRLRLASLSPAPDPGDPVLPARLVDAQFDCAARCLDWLDRTANRGRASLLRELRPSLLRTLLPRTDASEATVGPW
jgi:transcriptional regulator with XRE-family HTH domain